LRASERAPESLIGSGERRKILELKNQRGITAVFKATKDVRTPLLSVLLLLDSDVTIELRHYREMGGGSAPGYDPKEKPIVQSRSSFDLMECLSEEMLMARVRWLTDHTEGNTDQDMIICIDWAG
jgi:hypothetical protein